VQINKIAQVEKTRDAVPVALRPGLGEIDFDCLVWIKRRRHYPPCGANARGLTQLVAGIFPLMFVNLADHSTNLRSNQQLSAVAELANGSRVGVQAIISPL
jgi:hypothetical protein